MCSGPVKGWLPEHCLMVVQARSPGVLACCIQHPPLPTQLQPHLCALCAGNQAALGQTNAQLYFDGWSNFKRLKNNDPPYVQAYSSPVKIKLTPEVSSLKWAFAVQEQCSPHMSAEAEQR